VSGKNQKQTRISRIARIQKAEAKIRNENSNVHRLNCKYQLMDALIYKEEAYKIIGCCMEVHKTLGKGFSEIIYKEALEYEFQQNSIPYQREAPYNVPYKGIVLSKGYCADFIVFDKIVLEVKAIECLTKGDIKQTLNYLAATKHKLGLLVNFGEDSLVSKRIIL